MRRALPLLLILLAGLWGCRAGDDPRAPFTDSRIPPGLDHRFYPPQGWAWGLIQVGKAPPARYGVAAPPTTSRAQVLILPAYGEPAEAWFETARDLIAQGCVVWVLEGVGQGGSGRYALPRDLGHVQSLDSDVAALLAFPARVAREDRPLYVLASGESAPVALRAAALGLKTQGLFLSDPVLRPHDDPAEARRMRRFGLGGLRATGAHGWRRDQPEALPAGLDPVRRRVPMAWQIANPDLRMGGPSWGWRAAFADESDAALAAEPKVAAPVTVMSFAAPDSKPCGAIPVCTAVIVGRPGGATHLQVDGMRNLWRDVLLIAIGSDGAALAPTPSESTVEGEK